MNFFDLVPSLVSILVVLIGGGIALRHQRLQQQYERKKDQLDEIRSWLQRGMKLWSTILNFAHDTRAQASLDDSPTVARIREISDQVKDWSSEAVHIVNVATMYEAATNLKALKKRSISDPFRTQSNLAALTTLFLYGISIVGANITNFINQPNLLRANAKQITGYYEDALLRIENLMTERA